MANEDKEPAYMKLVRELATQEGITVQELLERDRRRAENPDFPTENCLTHDEARDLINAGITLGEQTKVDIPSMLPPLPSYIELEKLVAHLGQCLFCRIFLRSMTPPK